MSSSKNNSNKKARRPSHNSETNGDHLDHDDNNDDLNQELTNIPDSLKQVFSSKTIIRDSDRENPSLFNKTRNVDMNTDSTNVEQDALRKAEEIYKKLNIFNNIAVNAKSIPPLNNGKLLKKERAKQKELTTGKGWGDMPKVELTEEVKADLRAIRLRNFIYPKRFYKSNDSKKLPKYFQIGTIVGDKNDMKNERLTKKESKGRIADQFLKDDNSNQFSKKKYERLNDRRRRMGDKKKQLKMNKKRHQDKNKFKNKGK